MSSLQARTLSDAQNLPCYTLILEVHSESTVVCRHLLSGAKDKHNMQL